MDCDILKVVVIGKDLINIVEKYMRLVGINTVNKVNTGMLGNLTAITLEGVIPKKEIIKTRGSLMDVMARDDKRLMPMHVHNDWMRIVVMKPVDI